MRTLIGYEIRKIVKRKSFVIVTALFLALQVAMAVSSVTGKEYVDGKVYESHAQSIAIDRENGLKMDGAVMDDAFLQKMQEAYAKIEQTENHSYLFTETYQREVRPYDEPLTMLQYVTGCRQEQILSATEEELYAAGEAYREAQWEASNLSASERSYWEEKGEPVETPVVFEYYSWAYGSIISMNGCYMTLMMLTFLTAICFVNVFMVEANQRTDQMILCTKCGRRKLYAAKILAGIITAAVITVVFSMALFVGKIATCGAEGANVALQKFYVSWYPYKLTLGQTYLIMLGILLLGSLVTALITMVLAWLLKNSVMTTAIVSGALFVARLVYIPDRFRFFSKLWNLIPINLLKIDQGFVDMRLFSVCGAKLTTWQIAPIVYLFIMAAVIIIGGRVYCRTQIKGR